MTDHLFSRVPPEIADELFARPVRSGRVRNTEYDPWLVRSADQAETFVIELDDPNEVRKVVNQLRNASRHVFNPPRQIKLGKTPGGKTAWRVMGERPTRAKRNQEAASGPVQATVS